MRTEAAPNDHSSYRHANRDRRSARPPGRDRLSRLAQERCSWLRPAGDLLSVLLASRALQMSRLYGGGGDRSSHALRATQAGGPGPALHRHEPDRSATAMTDTNLYGRLLFDHQNNPLTGKCDICDEPDCWAHVLAASTMREASPLPSRDVVQAQAKADRDRITSRAIVGNPPSPRERPIHVSAVLHKGLPAIRAGVARARDTSP